MAEVVYRDAIVIFRVVTGKPRAARRFLTRLKKRLLRDFQQEDISSLNAAFASSEMNA
jgi:hypothetical protein